MSINIIDINKLLIQFSGDKKIIKNFLTICIYEIPQRIEHMKQALKDNDLVSVKLNAHTIKGIAANMRADSMMKSAENLEKNCIENQQQMIDMYIIKLEHDFVDIKAEISKNMLV
ncbi:Hpt domain-containing protein [Desulfonema limicola]|uniref:Hpt domain-containing protein n=1 Tax=Desulfonema limicola TaxID=45656 RepID=A0A975BBR8_9BACT|nr:Hpt domain-containing protein [Desulfonema limicola]QTA82330.1 Hpt domain-containing protein [Desulfonema limicola]